MWLHFKRKWNGFFLPKLAVGRQMHLHSRRVLARFPKTSIFRENQVSSVIELELFSHETAAWAYFFQNMRFRKTLEGPPTKTPNEKESFLNFKQDSAILIISPRSRRRNIFPLNAAANCDLQKHSEGRQLSKRNHRRGH